MMVRSLFRRRRPGRVAAVHHVSDGAQWVLDGVARSIADALNGQGLRSIVTADPWGLQEQIIHFHDRYTYFSRSPDRLHRSNRVFLTWFHGDPADPAMQPVFEKLHAALPRLERIVVSCSITREHARAAGVPGDKMVLIPLGVDLDLFAPPPPGARAAARARLGVPEEAICVGSFQKDGVGWGAGNEPKLVKGPDVLLDVIERLAQRVPDLFVLLTGPARGYVEVGLARKGVRCVRHQPDDSRGMAACYHALDLYLITSRVEGGPQALLESWATGVPIVSTCVGMPADLIAHGRNGMLAGVEDVAGLVDGAAVLLDDPELRARCRAQALEDVRAYAWPAIAGRYASALYRPLLQESGS